MGTGNDEVGEVRVTFYHWGRHICDATGRPVTHRERHRLARQQGSTHHMAMNDEERLQFAVAQELAAYTQERGPVTEYWDDAESFIAQLRGRGITLTPPPAPEPTYQIPPLSKSQYQTLLEGWHQVNQIHGWTPNERALFEVLRGVEPDPEPGT